MTKSPRKNVPGGGIELWATCMPSELASDRATAPLNFRTDMPGQTVQTQIRLQSDQGLHFCIVWTHFSMVEPHRSNFRVITTNVLGVRIFRKFTVNGRIYCLQFRVNRRFCNICLHYTAESLLLDDVPYVCRP